MTSQQAGRQTGQQLPRPGYRLVRSVPGQVSAPRLDDHQQRVVDHPGGPMLVLAGPGTGKTTTLVETIVDRIERRGASPDEVLALTFSRKAAEQLRDRVTARLGRTSTTTLSSTFHSFAYGLVRTYTPAGVYDGPLRLLSAPEADVVLRELLTDHPESVTWPDSLSRAVGTRGFAREVQAVLGRARDNGLDDRGLLELGRAEGAPELVAAGLFMAQYLDNLDAQSALDYSDLIRRATALARDHRDELRARFTHVFVDEYQDTDPGQVALLQELAGDGRNLTVVGDPHQSIYGFRGAEVRGILEFPTTFPAADGSPAEVVALRTTRRFGPRMLLAARRIAGGIALPGTIPEAARADFAAPVAEPGPHGDGRVEVLTFDTERAEAEHLADLLRRAHLEDGIAWDDMAVLVRSGRTSIPGLRRSLGAAGVPVEVAGDDVPLVRDPAALPLLDALRAILNLDNHDPTHVDFIDPTRAESMLLGPLSGLDAGQLRRLGRLLRAREKTAAKAEERVPRRSRDLVRQVLVDPDFLDGLEGPEVDRARAFAALLWRGRTAQADGDTAEEVLWLLWAGTPWPERLRRGVELGGAAARRAHRDLDAIVALFEAAARAEERKDHLGIANFLATLVAQQIPGDTLAERGVRGASVRLLTAHRAKGLEWRLVVVAHVQQDVWPDLRRRSTLLQADRIRADGLVPPVSTRELLTEERRLFYVACTRARQRLVVTAVASTDDEGEQPSRFLAELQIPPVHHSGRPRRPLSMAGLVSDLRQHLADPDTPQPLREAAARRLKALATESVGGRALVPQADPATWWGTRAASLSARPVRPTDEPVPLSASTLTGLMACPTQHFLSREAGGVTRSHQSANLGQIVHALAERVGTGELVAGPDDADLLMEHVDAVWQRLEFRTPWAAAREHARVRSALARFLAWHHANPRRLVDTETRFATVVELDDGEQVRLGGYVDRLEVDHDGRVVVVDLKTGRTKPSGPAVQRDRQLALYQLAVDRGAVDEAIPDAVSGGAFLVQLGALDDSPSAVEQRQDPQPDESPEREDLRVALSTAAGYLRREEFPAIPGDHCKDCPYVSLCPAKGAGSVVTL
ncbi:ATP-dependent helicase [Nocardioides sp. Soil805]|uniref:ATP-dependent helicase n=1 Tax=Nocardioides sp. Soil805 TaxID=1736416 RepID=UPI001F3E9369|nr:ATP-dependent DNA helicase [Nocardioides sp. Soil805]